MRTVLQRVSQASVSIGGEVKSSIGQGMLILLGIQPTDTASDIEYLCQKIVKLRIFDDAQGVPNLSVMDVDGELLVVSQFTLMASTRKGNRPSYIHAARPEVAIPLYDQFVQRLEQLSNRPVATGTFGADMQVGLVNNGPFTLILDSPSAE